MKRNFVLAACVLKCVFSHAGEDLAKKVMVSAYAHRINFDILRLGYEHIKPDAVYVGLECWYLLGFQSHGLRFVLGEVEGRIGYNLSLDPSNTLTPFVGGGYFKSFESGKRQEIAYPSLGLRYEHVFGSIFNLGLNLEGMLGCSLSDKRLSWGNPIWGVDIGLPLTWRFTETRCWDFRLEPFFTGWFGRNRGVVFVGARSAFGYRF